MIELTRPDRTKVRLDPKWIMRIDDAGASQHWHGVRANVQMGDLKWIEVSESPERIQQMIEASA